MIDVKPDSNPLNKGDHGEIALLIVAGVASEILYLFLYAIYGMYFPELAGAYRGNFSFPFLQFIAGIFKYKPTVGISFSSYSVYLLIVPYAAVMAVLTVNYLRNRAVRKVRAVAVIAVASVLVLVLFLPRSANLFYMTLLYNLILFGLVALYLIALSSVKNDSKEVRKIILIFAILFCVTLLFLPPFRSSDIFNYISYGKIVTVYEDNPYYHTPSYFAADPTLNFIGTWQRFTSIYGPVWVSFSAFLIKLAGKNLGNELMVFKLSQAFLVFFVGFVIYAINEKLGLRNSNARLLLFLWSPLLLVEIVGNGHNDILLISFVALGLLSYLYRHRVLAAMALTVSVMVKVVSLPLLLLYSMYLLSREKSFRSRAKKALILAFSISAIVYLTYFPYWFGPKIFGSLMRGLSFYYTSPVRLPFVFIRELFLKYAGFPYERAFFWTNLIIKIPTSLILLMLILKTLRKTDGDMKLFSAFLIVTLGYLLLTNYYMVWYSLWLMILIPFCQDKVLFLSAFSLTLTSTFISPLYAFGSRGISEYSLIFIIFTIPIAILVAGKLFRKDWIEKTAGLIWDFGDGPDR